MMEIPQSFLEFFRLLSDEAAEHLGEVTFPMISASIGDCVLTTFVLFFVTRWIFDIVVALGKRGGKY